ncbi:MAG: GntR family transcriptional regulator [Proteobacteria bacterium]|nr:GntR family transcriptional regulator [Pseudomonadota bacterium]
MGRGVTVPDANCDPSLSALERIPRSTLRDQVAERLRAAILGGDIPPGAPLVEIALSERFDVSRGPLREALRQLIEEGLVVTVPYTGTYVAPLSVEDVREIYSLRTALETFAFELIWDRRDRQFRSELVRRNAALIATIDAGDDRASIDTELAFHGLVYEMTGHRLLQRTWHGLRGRLQLYWAAHHRAHGRRGPRRDSHDSYIAAALGDDLAVMRAEIVEHMRRGTETTERFLRSRPPVLGKSKRGDIT